MEQNNQHDYIPETGDEVLFENTSTRDKTFFSEFFTCLYFKRPVYIVVYALMAVCFLVNLAAHLLKAEDSLFGLLFPPFYVVLMAFSVWLNTNSSYKRELENGNGTPIVYTLQFTPNTVRCVVSLGANYELPISSIKKVIQTKHYLLLKTPAKQFYPIKKDAFTKGNYEDFCYFLQSKNLKVKSK